MSRQAIYTPTSGDRVLRAAWILASAALPRSHTNAYVVRLGIAHNETTLAEVGVYDGTKQALKPMTAERMSGESAVTEPIPEGGVVFVDIEQRGTPVRGGLAVQLLLGRSTPFNAPRVEGREVRTAVDGMADELRSLGVDEEVLTIPLRLGVDTMVADLSETDGDSSLSSASWTGLRSVSIVPAVPGRYHALLWGSVSCKSSDAAGSNGYIRILDETRSLSTISVEVGSPGNAVGDECGFTVLYEGEITSATEFELQYYHTFGTGLTLTSAQLMYLLVPKAEA